MRVRPMPAWASGRRRRYFAPRGGGAWFTLRRWLSLLAPILVIIAIAWLATPLVPPAPTATLTGRAYIVDGDTLRFGADRVRLEGLDAPEKRQSCTDASGKRWSCGIASLQALVDLVDGRSLSCTPHGHDRYRRILATCRIGETNIAATQVEAGLAVAEGGYGAEERTAREAKRGIWAGQFERPVDWRRAHPDGVEETAWPSPFAIGLDWVRNMFFR